MPPGKTIAELLWGRSVGLAGRGSKALRPFKKSAFSHSPHLHNASRNGQAVLTSKIGGGIFISLLNDVFSVLFRAPGTVSPRRVRFETATDLVSRIKNSHASFHSATASRTTWRNIRPQAVPRAPAQLGLQTARSFSSSRPVFDTLIQNAPLGLRAIADYDDLDMRKYKYRMRSTFVRSALEHDIDLDTVVAERLWQSYPTSSASSSASSSIASSAAVVESVPSSQDVDHYFHAHTNTILKPVAKIVIPLNPYAGFSERPVFDAAEIEESVDCHRLLSNSYLNQILELRDITGRHNAKVRNLLNDLQGAGFFDADVITGESYTSFTLNRRLAVCTITFYGGKWKAIDIRQVLGVWPGMEPWYQIIDLENEACESSFGDVDSLPSDIDAILQDSALLSRTASATSSAGLHNSQHEHDRVMHSLCLPEARCVQSNDSYMLGVDFFIHTLDNAGRPFW